MENKVGCGFGHRLVLHSLPLVSLLEQLVAKKKVTVFMTGGMGEFDAQFVNAVLQLKKQYPFLHLILVKPYFTQELNTNQEQYAQQFDEIVIPEAAEGAHFKAAIETRNRWMVEHSDVVVSYVCRESGGAYKAVRYAEKCSKRIIHILEQA